MITQEQLYKRDQMAPTKIQGFFVQFPWILRHVKGQIDQVYVSGLESDLLLYKTAGDSSCLAGIDHHEELYLLDETGEIIRWTSSETVIRRRFYYLGRNVKVIKNWYFNGKIPVGSTLNEVLGHLGNRASVVRYILSYYPHNKAVILYKIPKNVSLSQWYEDEVKKEASKFHQEVNLIDREGEKA